MKKQLKCSFAASRRYLCHYCAPVKVKNHGNPWLSRPGRSRTAAPRHSGVRGSVRLLEMALFWVTQPCRLQRGTALKSRQRFPVRAMNTHTLSASVTGSSRHACACPVLVRAVVGTGTQHCLCECPRGPCGWPEPPSPAQHRSCGQRRCRTERPLLGAPHRGRGTAGSLPLCTEPCLSADYAL